MSEGETLRERERESHYCSELLFVFAFVLLTLLACLDFQASESGPTKDAQIRHLRRSVSQLWRHCAAGSLFGAEKVSLL